MSTVNERNLIGESLWLAFLWKEYRVLRGFWIALAGLAIAGQAIWSQALAPPGSDVAGVLFGIALVGAALYAAGAAAVLFAVASSRRRALRHWDLLSCYV